jgi:hypothetical protein
MGADQTYVRPTPRLPARAATWCGVQKLRHADCWTTTATICSGDLLLCRAAGTSPCAATSLAMPTPCRPGLHRTFPRMPHKRGGPPPRGSETTGPTDPWLKGILKRSSHKKCLVLPRLSQAASDLAARMRPRTLAVARSPLLRAFGASIGVAELLSQSEAATSPQQRRARGRSFSRGGFVRGLLRARFRSSLSGLLDTRRVTVTPCVGTSPSRVRGRRFFPEEPRRSRCHLVTQAPL